MRDALKRLRAALTPNVLLLLAAMFLLAFGTMGKREDASTALEKRIAQTLSAVEGAGRVRVVITMQQTPSAGLSSSQTPGAICGAVAVASGAGNPIVRFELQEALCALLDLPPSAVSVMTGGEMND